MALNIEFHHQTKRVRVSPGTTMFQVVETARELFALDATSQFELLHRGRAVDLSIPFRLTGVSNNAALELREIGATGSGAMAVQQVRVAVQLPDGKRVLHAFGSDATLQHLLTHFQQLPVAGEHEFSLTYMQREIPFDAFATTTLQELGIVSGSAMFRMVRAAASSGSSTSEPLASAHVVSPTAAATPAHVPTATPPPVSPKHVSFAPPPVAPAATSVAASVARSWSEEEEKSTQPPTPVAAQVSPASVVLEQHAHNAAASRDDDVEMALAEPPVAQLSAYDALQLLRDSCFDSVSRTAIITLMKIVTNVLSYPDNEKVRSVRVTNAAFERTVGRHKGGVEFLKAVGFELDEETETLRLTSAEQAKRGLEKALRLLNTEADDLNIQPAERPQVVVPMPVNEDFDAFKPIITRLQAQPRGPSATEVLVDNLKTKQEELLQRIEKPPRNTTIVFPGQQPSSSTIGQADVAMASDDGPSDSSLVIASMRARRAEMEKAQNFRTQAMRELDELKRKKVFQQALIRVQFPDRVIWQAAFHPMETVADVIAHLRESLDSRYVDAVSFYLYVSPPLQKLAPEKTLSDLGLVPAAHTYLSWIEGPQPIDVDLRGWYLRQELLTPDQSDSKSPDASGSTAYPNSIPLDDATAAKAAEAAKKAAAEAAVKRAAAGESKTKSGKKPTWLKL